jgi:hypothetical protein
VAEELVRAVRRAVDLHAVPLDDARGAAPARGPDHVDVLALLEDVDADLAADLVLLELLLADAALPQIAGGRDTGLLEVAGERLGGADRAAGAEPELEGGIAVAPGGLLLDDGVGTRLEHGDADALAVLGVHPRHSKLSAEQFDGHGRLSG